MTEMARWNFEVSSTTDADVRALGIAVPDGTVAEALNADTFVARRTTLGGPAPTPMEVQFGPAEARLRADLERQGEWQARFEAAYTRLLDSALP